MTPKEAKNYVAGTLEREQPYERLLRQVVLDGELTHDRTGVGTLSTFGTRMEFNLQDGFPLVTTKKCSCVASSRNCCGSLPETTRSALYKSRTSTSGMNGCCRTEQLAKGIPSNGVRGLKPTAPR